MALAVFFLLTGTLAAEVSLLGLPEAGYVGAALFLMCAVSLVRVRLTAPRLPSWRQ